MREEDLIKKLEEISLPKIEIKSHKERLNLTLMKKYSPERKKAEVFNIFKKLVPAGVIAVLLFLFIFNNLNSQKYNLAKAKEIALQNNEIKNWLQQGSIIKDIKVVDGKAYVLIEPPEVKKEPEEPAPASLKSGVAFQENLTGEEKFGGALAEVNIKEKEVKNIKKLAPAANDLIKSKKDKALEIANKSQEVQEKIPREAEVLNINVTTPKFRLSKEGNSVSAIPETETEEKASIIYQFDENQCEGKVDLNKERMEEIKCLNEINTGATKKESER